MANKSSFREWHRKSSVRTKPQRSHSFGSSGKPLYFAPELVPVCSHALIQDAKATEDLLVQVLYAYLSFTGRLELEIVNATLCRIIQGEFDDLLPESMVEDAYKILCDETYHAQQSDELARQLRRHTGIAPISGYTPRFIALYRRIPEEFPEDHKQLCRIMMTVVSETLVSGTLRRVQRNPQVHDAVRHVINDHALDESRHQAYFASLLGYLWKALTTAEKKMLGCQIPRFIAAFVAPDHAAINHILCAMGFDPAEAARGVSDSYPADEAARGVRASALGTLQAANRAGVLEMPEVADAFIKAGLLDEQGAGRTRPTGLRQQPGSERQAEGRLR